MTIIEPNKQREQSYQFVYIAALLFTFAVSYIYLYNLNVSLKYQISVKEKEVQRFESSNADLRNELYSMLDIRNLDEVIKKHNLVQDKNPSYVEHRGLAKR
ncbi:hypothetical protein GW950_00010 [Candidatus Wolfebacteria bacterium]|nr:hypothetical protein [Candidatus Wolfebacteria bacterium]